MSKPRRQCSLTEHGGLIHWGRKQTQHDKGPMLWLQTPSHLGELWGLFRHDVTARCAQEESPAVSTGSWVFCYSDENLKKLLSHIYKRKSSRNWWMTRSLFLRWWFFFVRTTWSEQAFLKIQQGGCVGTASYTRHPGLHQTGKHKTTISSLIGFH